MRKRVKKRLFIFAGVFLLLILASAVFLVLRKPSHTGASTMEVEIVPLNQEEVQKFAQTILSSDFLKSLPEKYPISITFFDFQNGERRWRSSFLFNNKGFLTSGTPEISITLHSKYISQLSSGNFCEIVQKANKAGDLGFHSESGTVSLLLKYAGMLKYRSCFGF